MSPSRFAAYSRPPSPGTQEANHCDDESESPPVSGVITAIVYSLFVASTAGLECLGFVLHFVSALSIGAWAHLGGHRGILLPQFFYAVEGLIGMVRWF